MHNPRWTAGGFHVLPELASGAEQLELARLGTGIIASAPLLVPRMPDGTPFRCQVTGAGEGMFFASQLRGYHYAKRHPATGARLPPIPELVLAIGRRALERAGHRPCGFDSMLLNVYDADAEGRLGLHVDAQELDVTKPLVSISLGADCAFLIGGTELRGFKADRVVVCSGDAVVMAGRSRMWFHGVERTWHTLVSPLPPGIRWAFLLRAAFS